MRSTTDLYYDGRMAYRTPDQIEYTRSRRDGSFAVRYPDYLSWLDGGNWVLVVGEDIPSDQKARNSFRSSLHYQARCLGLSLATTEQERDGKRVMIVQAT